VTISRSWTRWSVVREKLTEIHAYYPDAVLHHGDAPQGDRQAAGIWRDLGGAVERHPADWKRYGRAAGFRRNAEMVELVGSGPHLILAFIHNHSKGARHTYDLAMGAGLNCLLYEHNDEEGQ
jgi:hypothetical protein